MEKEQHDILQSKYKVLIEEYDAKIKESENLSNSLNKERNQYKTLYNKYMENISYIEDVERKNKSLNSLNKQLTEELLKPNIILMNPEQ